MLNTPSVSLRLRARPQAYCCERKSNSSTIRRHVIRVSSKVTAARLNLRCGYLAFPELFWRAHIFNVKRSGHNKTFGSWKFCPSGDWGGHACYATKPCSGFGYKLLI